MFADTGKGISALAMQIAQSIASGRGIKPFTSATKPQKVLYLDLEMNDKQFGLFLSSTGLDAKVEAVMARRRAAR